MRKLYCLSLGLSIIIVFALLGLSIKLGDIVLFVCCIGFVVVTFVFNAWALTDLDNRVYNQRREQRLIHKYKKTI